MKKLNFAISLLLAALLIFGQIGAAKAETATPTPPITGTIQTITVKTDSATNTTYVELTIQLADNTVQPLKLKLDAAVSLGLVTKQTDGTYLANPTKIGQSITIDSTQMVSDTNTDSGFKHPIGLILEAFFGKDLAITYDDIMTYHADGVGFGVLAQAMWMTKNLEGDSALLDQIIAAKQSGDYSAITLPDGTMPKNWGQLRKAALDKGNNLGATKGKDNDKSDDKGTGKPDDRGNGKPDDTGNGKDKNKDRGNGKGNGKP